MTKEEAINEVINHLYIRDVSEAEAFLGSLLNLNSDPIAWLKHQDVFNFRRVIKKYYYKEYKFIR